MPTVPMDRRNFLHRAALLGTAVSLAGLGSAGLVSTGFGPAQAQTADLVARKVFFDNPDYVNVRVSPDGQTLAWIAPIDSVNNLWVAPVADIAAAWPVTRITGRSIATYFRWVHTNRHLIFFRDNDGDENYRAFSVDLQTGTVVPLTPEGAKSFVQELDGKFPAEALLKHNQRNKRYFDLFRINVITGASELVHENNEYVWVVTDSDFKLRLAAKYAADGSAEVFERRADGSFAPFMTIPIGDLDMTSFVDFSADGKTLYLIDARGRDKAAVFAVDMVTRNATLLAADEEADISVLALDEQRRPLAARSVRDRVRWQAIDPAAGRHLADFAGRAGDVTLVSSDNANRLMTVHYERDTESGEFALLDRQTHEVRKLFSQRKSLAGVALSPMQPVVIPSRDGLSLHGYLTKPLNAPGGPMPMVLVIHGGPYLRDNWGFNSVHQWLANRGYAVLSVNYRGSTGYGKAFVKAADREWGGKMHDDLIDAVNWAVDQGIADSKRVGFYGGSYGGYSALTAATKTPEVFACIVDIFGISSLVTFMATIPPYWGPWFSIWKNRLGDPDTEAGRAFLLERSPITRIDKVVRPILIAQGMRDVRVVAAESEQMVNALKQRNVPVTYITFPDEGHGFVRPENRMAFTAITEAFLAKHLGGRYQPVGGDFAGSSLKIETGGELVPGISG
jgi:dipeptidyl aminopeptidase/acylaminoacyl peptidase